MSDEMLLSLLNCYSSAVTCLCFMGGDAEPLEIERLAKVIKSIHSNIKVAWYSGKETLPEGFDLGCLDYLKLGPYIERLGGLKSPTTNQALYRIDSDGTLEKITF